MQRPNKTNWYLNIAETVAQRSTCLRRMYGAIIVKDGTVVSDGYNSTPIKMDNCLNKGICNRANCPRGTGYELCYSIHAEQNAIINCSKSQLIGSELYLVGLERETGEYVENSSPCNVCKKIIINAQISKVYIRIDKENYKEIDVSKWTLDDIVGGY